MSMYIYSYVFHPKIKNKKKMEKEIVNAVELELLYKYIYNMS